MNTIEKDKKYIAGTYNRFPVVLSKGKGSLVWDEDGKEYIDLGTGIGVNAFGYSDEIWKTAVETQLSKIQHTSNLYYTEPCANLAEILCTKTGMKKVFFSNSGAEANECAIKVARKWDENKHTHGDSGKDNSGDGNRYGVIVTLVNSFHGRTLGTLAATGQDVFHEHFQPLPVGFVSVPAEDVEALWKVGETNRIAAVMIECVQGEGGVVPLSEEYIQSIQAFVKEKDALLIVDEVQTGNGRTGKLFSYMHYGLSPDIVTTAKGLGGGLPIGATLLGEKVENVLLPGDHGSTFGGNPVACAGAISILKRLDNALMDEVQRKSKRVSDVLSGAKGIKGITGKGLMLGIQVEKPAKDIASSCMEKGVLVLTAKDKIRLLPALNIPEEKLLKALDIIKESCGE